MRSSSWLPSTASAPSGACAERREHLRRRHRPRGVEIRDVIAAECDQVGFGISQQPHCGPHVLVGHGGAHVHIRDEAHAQPVECPRQPDDAQVRLLEPDLVTPYAAP